MGDKLTLDDRRAIRDRLISFRFDAIDKALAEREAACAEECLTAQFTPDELRLLAKIPPKWLGEFEYIRVNIGGMVRGLHFASDRTKYAPMFVCGTVVAVPDELGERVLDFIHDREANDRAQREVKVEVMGLLKSVTTFKKLVAVWPEVKPFLVGIEDGAAPWVTTLAVPIAGINLHLGLPVP